jgi:hypothetical protein
MLFKEMIVLRPEAQVVRSTVVLPDSISMSLERAAVFRRCMLELSGYIYVHAFDVGAPLDCCHSQPLVIASKFAFLHCSKKRNKTKQNRQTFLVIYAGCSLLLLDLQLVLPPVSSSNKRCL